MTADTPKRQAARLLASAHLQRGLLHAVPRTKAPARPTRAAGQAVQSAAGPAYKKFRRSHNELAGVWPEIVGATLAQLTRPEHYQPGTGLSNNGVLTVKVAGAIALDLQHMAPQVIERVNGYFGYQAIARLKIVQGPLPNAATSPRRAVRPLGAAERRALTDSLKPIDHDGLRAVLARLGTKILGRREP